MHKVYRNRLKNRHAHACQQFSMTTAHTRTMARLLEKVRNMHYRSIIWIATKLADDLDLPQETCNPISLFEQMIQFNHLSWGHYVCFLHRLNGHFPLNGPSIFHYLKKLYPSYHYSFTYLTTQWCLYHGFEIILAVHRLFGTWLIRWCQRLFPSA